MGDLWRFFALEYYYYDGPYLTLYISYATVVVNMHHLKKEGEYQKVGCKRTSNYSGHYSFIRKGQVVIP